jgi:hypothetical protein
VVADGFSCKTQIKDAGTGRHALHLAQLMKLARDQDGQVSARKAEKEHVGRRPAPSPVRRSARVAAVGAAAALGAAVVAGSRPGTRR